MSDTLRLEVPAHPEFLSFVRLTVGGVATMNGALLDEIEDLQLATEELCLQLLPEDHGPAGPLLLEVEWTDTNVHVRCSVDGTLNPSTDDVADEDLPPGAVARILDLLVEEHGLEVEEGRTVSWLRTSWASAQSG